MPQELRRSSNFDCIIVPAMIAPVAKTTVPPAATHVHLRPSHQPRSAAGSTDGRGVCTSTEGGTATGGGGIGYYTGETGATTASNRGRTTTVSTVPATTVTFRTSGVAFGFVAVTWWLPGMTRTMSTSGARPDRAAVDADLGARQAAVDEQLADLRGQLFHRTRAPRPAARARRPWPAPGTSRRHPPRRPAGRARGWPGRC